MAGPVLLAGPIPASGAVSDGEGFHPEASAAHRGGQILAQEGPFRERMRERREAKIKDVERDLEKNPKLVDDPNYLEQHPRLESYLKKHPAAKSQIKKNPKAFFEHLEGEL
jgi:hypothetical protein